jgi:hypothetical protein
MFVKLLGDIVTPFKNNIMKLSTCCGAPLWETETPICSECKEHCDWEDDEDEPSN